MNRFSARLAAIVTALGALIASGGAGHSIW